jgi:hypothetical protein
MGINLSDLDQMKEKVPSGSSVYFMGFITGLEDAQFALLKLLDEKLANQESEHITRNELVIFMRSYREKLRLLID